MDTLPEQNTLVLGVLGIPLVRYHGHSDFLIAAVGRDTRYLKEKRSLGDDIDYKSLVFLSFSQMAAATNMHYLHHIQNYKYAASRLQNSATEKCLFRMGGVLSSLNE